MSSLTHYADIYDPEDKKHSDPRWDQVSEIYRYYEGYGQRGCLEKRDFLASINRDHELWSGETPERKVGCRVFTRDEHIDRMLTESDVGRQVDFLGVTLGWVDFRGYVVHPFMRDGRDRTDRLSWNFSKMLADYCEKAHGVEEKKKFFKLGGAGGRWGKDKVMMKQFGPLFERIQGQLGDEDYKISLSDQSVKDYPRYHFNRVYERYKEVMKCVSRLNPDAPVFIPRYDSKPIKPNGPPPPRRPMASSKDSSSQFVWEIKNEADTKIENLEKKLDYLIHMNGPVVEAEAI